MTIIGIRYRNLAVKQKLRLIIMATVSVALVLACATVLAYDQVAARDSLRNDLGVLAEIFGANSSAALSFNDRSAAEELLSALRAKQHVVAAFVYTADDKLFASYRRPQTAPIAAPGPADDRSWFEPNRLVLFRSVALNGQRIGSVCLVSDLGELSARLRRFAGIVMAILFGATLLALSISSKLQRVISEPIAHLAGVAQAVSLDKNYGMRAIKQAEDDLGRLTDTFNGMLSEIERRDEELTRHRDRLEEQVFERTAELVKSNAELTESEAMLKALVDTASEGIVIADTHGKIISINPKAEEIFKWPAAEAIGQPLSILMPGRFQEAHQTGLLLGKTVELAGMRRTGEEFPLDLSLASWKAGDKTFFNAMIRDLTERKRLENELTQAHKLESIGQLAAGIAHEINTPIQYVGDNTRFLQDAFGDLLRLAVACDQYVSEHQGESGSSDQFAGINSIRQQVDLEFLKNEAPKALEESLEGVTRVAAIVRAMKEFSHPGPQERAPTDINHAIHNTTLVSKSEWKYIADLVEEFDASLPPVICLAGEINQVVLNLIVNAAHAIADVAKARPGGKGTIRVRTQREAEWARIDVCDTGSGIPEHVRPHVFNLFFTTKEVGKGTGQGLAFAYATVVQKHGGKISFDTEVGVGTTFTIRLPLAGARGGVQ